MTTPQPKFPKPPKEEAWRPPPVPEIVRCCGKAYVVGCACGGARQCPDHGLGCFGKGTHD